MHWRATLLPVRFRGIRHSLGLAVLAGYMLAATPVPAGPANDDFACRDVLGTTTPISVKGNTIGPTAEVGKPGPATSPAPAASVGWFRSFAMLKPLCPAGERGYPCGYLNSALPIPGTRFAPTPVGSLPRSLLYAISARIGGTGLDNVAHQTLIGAHRSGFLGRAIAWDNRQRDVPHSRIRSLRWHPVRLLSFLDRQHYYGAKKQYVDWIASRELATGRYDCFHGWSGDALRTLRVARRMNIPSLIEIPTWHRNKGKQKPPLTKSERELRLAPWHERLLHRLVVSRQAILEEYDLADVLLVQSSKAAETFLAAAIPPGKLFMIERAVDASRFHPGPPPKRFRALFVGALIERKGVHILLEAWRKLRLPNAELVLAGTIHDEIRPHLERFGGPDVLTPGFTDNIAELYRSASIHVFPSLCEGSAKVVFEAAASGLAQVMTREAGDFVVDGVHGRVVPAEDVDALAAAIRELHDHPDRTAAMGAAARALVEQRYTWDHFRRRMLDAYRLAAQLVEERTVRMP